MEVHGDGTHGMASGGSGATYRLNIDLGLSFTSAGYQSRGQSVALRLGPFRNDLASARFLENGRVQLGALAELLRGIVVIANEQLGELPASVRLTYPASWESRQLLQLWEALVLAGIPDAVTQPAAEPKLSVAIPPSEADTGQLPSDVPTQLVAAPPPLRTAPQPRSTRRNRPGLLIGAAILTVMAGVSAGAITTGVVRDAGAPEAVEPQSSSSSVASEPPARASSGRVTAVPAVGVDLPASHPLAPQQFVVPSGRAAGAQLHLASVAGVVPPRKLSDHKGRNSWPLLSADRRTIIYINYLTGTVRTMAADGSGDRLLIRPGPRGCREITRASWSPADQSIMVVECRAEGRPDRLLVMKLDGTVVRELKTGMRRIEDPTISPDGRTVAYWAHPFAGGPNGGSIYTLAIDGASQPVRLTNRKAGSDADPSWSPDGNMIAFRRRVAEHNFDVYVMRSDGSGVRPVATGPGIEEKPAWSPDGSQMMIISNREPSGKPGKTYDLYVFDVHGGGTPRPLGLAANVVLTPVWSYR